MAIYRERLNYGNMAKDAVEIGGSFILNGFTGRFVENKLKPDVTPASTTSDKIIAGVANNLPKVGLYYIFNMIKLKGAAAAAMGSVGYDALIRATNGGINPASIYINQYRVLNQMNQMQPIADWAERQKQFGAMPTTPDILNRQRRYGAMPFQQNPEIVARQRRYGAMPFQQNPETINRQRRYGAMSIRADSLEGMGFKPEPKDEDIHKLFNMR